MFTGIITETGRVSSFVKNNRIHRIAVDAPKTSKGISIGDSVAVDGACLTVVKIINSLITFDVMDETARRSTIAHLKEGDIVNLEGSMKADGRFDGHFVQGHIDCIGTIRSIGKSTGSFLIDIDVPEGFNGLYVNKGSIAIDGVSLTIGECRKNGFNVYIIPHTLKATTLMARKPGDGVNVEFDVIGKYISKTQESKEEARPRSEKVTEKFLQDKGFI